MLGNQTGRKAEGKLSLFVDDSVCKKNPKESTKKLLELVNGVSKVTRSIHKN